MSLRALWIISHEKGENASIRFSRYVASISSSVSNCKKVNDLSRVLIFVKS